MIATTQVWLAVGVVAVMTFCLRLAPFVAARRAGGSRLFDFLSSATPLGVMIVLVAYTLAGTGPHLSSWVAPLAGVGVTALLHLWRRSVALSLVGGTGVYVAASLWLG